MLHRRFLTAASLVAIGSLLLIADSVHADFTFGTGADQFTMTTVAVGNAGNSADSNGNGSVSYSYEVMKYEVTRGMVFKFNNLNDASSGSRDITLDLGYDPSTETNVFNPHRFNTYGDIASGYKDTLSATGIGGLEAAQFVNWLNVDAGYSPAYNLDTNSDSTDLSTWSIAAWDSGATGYLASQPFRNSEARFFLMNFDEAYKAAFYDGATDSYFDYATSSNTTPDVFGEYYDSNSELVWQGTDANSVATFGNPRALTEADQAGGVSPYGVMGITGNSLDLTEFTSAAYMGAFGGSVVSGGSAGLASTYAHSSTLFNHQWDIDTEYSSSGFRVLFADLTSGSSGGGGSPTVPEPGTAVTLGLLGVTGFLNIRRRRRCSIN